MTVAERDAVRRFASRLDDGELRRLLSALAVEWRARHPRRGREVLRLVGAAAPPRPRAPKRAHLAAVRHVGRGG